MRRIATLLAVCFKKLMSQRINVLRDAAKNIRDWYDLSQNLAARSKIEKGWAFEELTKVYLSTDAAYQSKLKHVWHHEEVPSKIAEALNLPNRDKGIDIIAETHDGEYWAIQCKYRQEAAQTLTHGEVSTFTSLAFHSCRGISYALVFTTTDRATDMYDSDIKIGFCCLDTWTELDAGFYESITPLLTVGKIADPTPSAPRPHQENAVQAAQSYYSVSNHRRGKLIMPCGTGKSLTAWLITKTLSAKLVLITVPSLALVKQTLRTWCRESRACGIQLDWLCVCSDDSVGNTDDNVVTSQRLGVPCTTDASTIKLWLNQKSTGLKLLITTYHSTSCVSAAIQAANATFDLTIIDEAHKTAGDKSKPFARVLFDEEIPSKRRLFMTATERHYVGDSDEIASMSSTELYGETFFELTFKGAIESSPAILCDYQVLTVGVSREEIESMIRKNTFVRPHDCKWTDEIESEMLAALIALRKAMASRPITHAVSFHSSIQRAHTFRSYNDLATRTIPELGKLTTFHVTGATAVSERIRIIDDFVKAKRALITNARCLTEGVDVPTIDCVLFADPRNSKVDIVQAVGRALRLSPGKQIGYVIVPVIFDESATDLDICDTEPFAQVIRTIRALASSDERIIEEFRTQSSPGNRLTATRRVVDFLIPSPVDVKIEDFTRNIYLRCWDRLSGLQRKLTPNYRDYKSACEFVHKLDIRTKKEWKIYAMGMRPDLPALPDDIPKEPWNVYSEVSWGEMNGWLGISARAYKTFEDAKYFARSLKLRKVSDWRMYCDGRIPTLPKIPADIPTHPNIIYKGEGWISYDDWIGKKAPATIPYAEAQAFARSLKLKSQLEWKDYLIGRFPSLPRPPEGMPTKPEFSYQGCGWKDYAEWLGTKGAIQPAPQFQDALSIVHKLGLTKSKEYKAYVSRHKIHPKGLQLPIRPEITYAAEWKGWRHWLGLNKQTTKALGFDRAHRIASKLGLHSKSEYHEAIRTQGHTLELYQLPMHPDRVYAATGWKGWRHWLGYGQLID